MSNLALQLLLLFLFPQLLIDQSSKIPVCQTSERCNIMTSPITVQWHSTHSTECNVDTGTHGGGLTGNQEYHNLTDEMTAEVPAHSNKTPNIRVFKKFLVKCLEET